jgi:hypothetical protein
MNNNNVHNVEPVDKKVRLRGKKSSWPMIIGLLLVLALIIWLVMLYADSFSTGFRAIVGV